MGELLSCAINRKIRKGKRYKNILLTTSTLSSSNLFKKFKFKKTFHKFYPIDNYFIVNKFLNYWKPSAVFFVESEIWPEMLKILKLKKIKVYLLNARISKRSFKRWKYLKKIATNLFNSFDYIFPQSKETQKYLKYFNLRNIEFLGNLKFSETEKKILINPCQNYF